MEIGGIIGIIYGIILLIIGGLGIFIGLLEQHIYCLSISHTWYPCNHSWSILQYKEVGGLTHKYSVFVN